jgi:hypothetical protein
MGPISERRFHITAAIAAKNAGKMKSRPQVSGAPMRLPSTCPAAVPATQGRYCTAPVPNRNPASGRSLRQRCSAITQPASLSVNSEA